MAQARAVRLHGFGEPEVMGIETLELAAPGAGEVQIRQTAIGFNFIDVYQRRGIYPLPPRPALATRRRASSRRSVPASPP